VLHMVIFRGAEGKPGYHQADTLDGAVGFVERLRNDDGVTDVRVFRMEDVPIEFKPYFRVEVVDHTAAAADVEAPVAEAATPTPEPTPDSPIPPAASATAATRGFALFGRSSST
jgi:hypothetical protein